MFLDINFIKMTDCRTFTPAYSLVCAVCTMCRLLIALTCMYDILSPRYCVYINTALVTMSGCILLTLGAHAQ